MKKIIVPLLLVIIMSFGVFAWGATRTVSGDTISITVDKTSSGSPTFTIQETVGSGITISSITGCNKTTTGNFLTCDYDSDLPKTLSYKVSGSGTITGTITGKDSGVGGTWKTKAVSPAITIISVLPGCTSGAILTCPYTGPINTNTIGVCKEGTKTCSAAGVWSSCVGEVTPSTEICDGKDNDCDGTIDDGATATCQSGLKCVSGKCISASLCSPMKISSCYTGTASTANVGVCKEGTKICNVDGASWSSCNLEVKPSTEICGDNKDNDCDGSTDEGCTPSPVCPAPLFVCSNKCVDTRYDPLNCGGCGIKCTSGSQVCDGGSCNTVVFLQNAAQRNFFICMMKGFSTAPTLLGKISVIASCINTHTATLSK